VLTLLLSGKAYAANEVPAVSAHSMILMHPDSGLVLAEKNADESMLIASTTKLMTALVALEKLDPDREVVVDPLWTKVEGSSMYLRPGESYAVRDLLYGLMLASGNDAALALAYTVSGSPEEFAVLMNEKAQSLGLTDTHFTNPHGLDHEDHYSTARDMAVLMSAVLDNEILSQIIATKSYSTHGATYVNHNKLLWRCKGVNGGKTGYTKAAGRCLVTSCEREDLSLVCVTLSAGDDWQDHTKLYDWTYSAYKSYSQSSQMPLADVPVVAEDEVYAEVGPSQDVSLCVAKDSCIETRLYLPRFVFPKVSQGAVAGEFSLLVDGVEVGRWPLVWMKSIGREMESWRMLLDRISRSIFSIYYF